MIVGAQGWEIFFSQRRLIEGCKSHYLWTSDALLRRRSCWLSCNTMGVAGSHDLLAQTPPESPLTHAIGTEGPVVLLRRVGGGQRLHGVPEETRLQA